MVTAASAQVTLKGLEDTVDRILQVNKYVPTWHLANIWITDYKHQTANEERNILDTFDISGQSAFTGMLQS